MPNPNARQEEAAALYRRFGLNERQIEIIADAVPKRQYYYVSERGRRLYELALGPLALALVAITAVAYASTNSDAKAAVAAAPAPPPGFTLTWSDDFNGAANSGVDAGTWKYDTGPGSTFGTGGDLMIVPDPAAEVDVDFGDNSAPEHFFLGDIRNTDGTPWECCPREFLRRAIAALDEPSGYGPVPTNDDRLRDWPRRPRRRRAAEREMQEELDSLAALAGPGDLGSIAMAAESARQTWRFTAAGGFWADLRYALRLLVRQPGLTLIASLSLDLAAASNIRRLTGAAIASGLPRCTN